MSKQPETLRLADILEWQDFDKAAAELRRLHQVELAFLEWQEKTDWVQTSSEIGEVGAHRADAMKQRIERLQDENESLKEQLNVRRGRFYAGIQIWCGNLVYQEVQNVPADSYNFGTGTRIDYMCRNAAKYMTQAIDSQRRR